MRKSVIHPSTVIAEKIVMFRADTSKRFLKQPDSSWLVPIVCEGIAGSRFPALLRMRTPATPAQDIFWTEANLACRNLRLRGYALVHEGDSIALYRRTDTEIIDL